MKERLNLKSTIRIESFSVHVKASYFGLMIWISQNIFLWSNIKFWHNGVQRDLLVLYKVLQERLIHVDRGVFSLLDFFCSDQPDWPHWLFSLTRISGWLLCLMSCHTNFSDWQCNISSCLSRLALSLCNISLFYISAFFLKLVEFWVNIVHYISNNIFPRKKNEISLKYKCSGIYSLKSMTLTDKFIDWQIQLTL